MYNRVLRVKTVIFHWSILGICLALQSPHNGIIISRQNLLVSFGKSLPTILFFPPRKGHANDAVISQLAIPLTFLPRGGCLAVKIILNDKRNEQRIFSYYAIVDTGSPFVTAPATIKKYSRDESRRYPRTQEQYGEAIGTMEWRSVSNVEIPVKPNGMTGSHTDYSYVENPFPTKLLVGLPESNVVDDTGEIFLGLIQQDNYRPSVLQQWGYPSFILDYPAQLLTLSKQSVVDIRDDNTHALTLFDFSPYDDNIHHYGVQCLSFLLEYGNETKGSVVSSLKRPVIAVIDSGLTGCIFSDSLREELVTSGHLDSSFLANQQLSGLQVTLPTTSGSSVTLSSNPDYWFLSSFKLPWFNDDNSHPHVIALGATFLAKSRIYIDPLLGRAAIEGPTLTPS